MTRDDAPKGLDELLSPGSTLMVGFGAAATEFRPLTVARLNGNTIEILLDTTDAWTASLEPGIAAVVTLSDERKNDWASLTGTATTTTDSSTIDDLWNPAAAAYFEQGRDTPGITVLRIDVADGRYWSSPSGRLGSLVSMIRAKLGGAETSGEHGPVAL